MAAAKAKQEAEEAEKAFAIAYNCKPTQTVAYVQDYKVRTDEELKAAKLERESKLLEEQAARAKANDFAESQAAVKEPSCRITWAEFQLLAVAAS